MNIVKKYLLLIVSVFLILVAAWRENQMLRDQPETKAIQEFQQTLLEQETKLNNYLTKTEVKITESLKPENYNSTFSDLNHLFEDEGFGFIIYKRTKMIYWTNNQFAFPNLQNKASVDSKLITLPNGIYLVKTRLMGIYRIIGLIHIKNNYSYENQYLENKFVKPFKLPPGYKINISRTANAAEIHDLKNQYLFTVSPSSEEAYSEWMLYIPTLLYLIAFILLLIFAYRKSDPYKGKNVTTKMVLLGLGLFAIYAIHVKFKIPAVLDHIGLFSASYYASSLWIPSLGDFFLICILFFFWSLVLAREISTGQFLRQNYLGGSFGFVAILYQLTGLLISNLISNSNINYKLNRITDIDQYSIAGYLVIAILLFSVFLIHLRVIQRTEYLNRKSYFLLFNLVSLIIAFILCFVFPSGFSFMLVLFFSVNLLQSLIRKMHIAQYSLSYAVLHLALFSVISLMVVYNVVKKRDLEFQKLRATTLSSEQDPIADVLLSRMQTKFDNDSIIPTLLNPQYFDKLENYVTRSYFSGYFRKYDIRYWFCTATDSIYDEDAGKWESCYPFFDQMIDRSGTKILSSNFNFMNNYNGRITYLGKLKFKNPQSKDEASIYIEINSKTISDGIGFPELLLDRSLVLPFRYKYLSYAKYYERKLVSTTGDYQYKIYLAPNTFDSSKKEYQTQSSDGYNHLVYKIDNKNLIIVSNRALKLRDYLISFPYIFVFYFVFVLVVILIRNTGTKKITLGTDLRFKIQGSIISVVLISHLFVATGTIYYNILEYRSRHQVDLQEKIKSISEEIRNRLFNVSSIDPELQQWLYSELNKLSNIFRTDINIYDTSGELIATSRPEMIEKGIISNRINTKALYELASQYQQKYFQPEKIGSLSYLSAYEPILNSSDEYLGYLNLPYFTREDDLKQGISTFIVAFINLYLILFLTSVFIAIFLSNKITQPLSLIREKLKGIELGKKNEHIDYSSEDEIGALVKEYNHKVDDLMESAEMLARSERESAWREMAKQIAHEIKNPLTPMKLNIQYLQKAKEEGKEHYDDYFNRVTKNLIEQIDTLSGIATEFSNFAQIPKAKNEVFNLIEVIVNVCSLFEQNENLTFSLNINDHKEIKVFIDKEQFARAMLNLIKNGIQAIPGDQKGLLKISVLTTEKTAIIQITDNGTGISNEAQENLFQPNFTTKTSGMGLGLSIVKNIIDNFGGRIWYHTKLNMGTTFFVEIPVYKPESSKNGEKAK